MLQRSCRSYGTVANSFIAASLEGTAKRESRHLRSELNSGLAHKLPIILMRRNHDGGDGDDPDCSNGDDDDPESSISSSIMVSYTYSHTNTDSF